MLVKRALISVSDKAGLDKLIKVLAKHRFEIISSGGTAQEIRKLGFHVMEVADYTKFPESPDGSVKTLHPKIHGGLALNPSRGTHKSYMNQQGILPIDLLVVNLYPFEKIIADRDSAFRKAIENIDIGGPAMIRAAAKAALLHGRVAVVVEPAQYEQIIEELEKNRGEIKPETKRKLAVKAFARTAQYDENIKNYLDDATKK